MEKNFFITRFYRTILTIIIEENISEIKSHLVTQVYY